ncbi:rod shape-determining protein MreC [Sinobacterium caligoides]|uniref:Cell shape-determining protein MreC n=1 Tax=Sinobacterium caligoides TaxID=933926 RepID=A0A3N2DNH9_9GAMM|nr:rod shape-determining protein MreC [Sinobacterium caligoides]ROS01242.1 rod shape-determining protein MreC [Sinobacterium caligoides]
MGNVIKPLFGSESSLRGRFTLLVIIAIVLVVMDYRTDKLGIVRYVLSTATAPTYWLTDLPKRFAGWGKEHTKSRSMLIEENDALKAESLVLRGRVLKLAALAAENVRLRELLNSSALLRNDVVVAEVIGVSPNPQSHTMVINKGAEGGVYVGQPVLESRGVLGQVIEVTPWSSRVLMITDSSHAIPVQVNRNGVRAVAEGDGLLDELELRHVAATTDIQEGDLLVSSGLGNRFPQGYPVARVSSVIHDPGRSFMAVKATPIAQLDRTRHVLLVFHQPEEVAPEEVTKPPVVVP